MGKIIKRKYGSDKLFFFCSESATSTVIGAVLLLGIIFSVLCIVRTEYVPEWKNEAEYSHMDDVWEDMADLKSKIDMMSIVLVSNSNPSDTSYSDTSSSDTNVSDTNASDTNASDTSTSDSGSLSSQPVVSIPFHMGGGNVPFIGPIKSSGTLAVNNEKFLMAIKVSPTTGTESPFYKSINCGTITYRSQNNYYVDQVFSYEGGALILKQKEQTVMMLYPSICFSRTSTNEYDVSINTVKIFKDKCAPSEAISSNDRCSLRLTGLEYNPLYDSDKDNLEGIDNFTLTIYTKYPEAWEPYLRKVMKDAGMNQDDYTLEPGDSKSSLYLTFPSESSTSGLKRLYLSETLVKAELGIGLS
jgi:hypothetical protein